MSCVHHLCLITIADLAWPCLHKIPSSLWVVCTSSLLDFNHWPCLHKIWSRLWVVCTSSGSFQLLTLPTWNLIQGVSSVHLLCLLSINDFAFMKSYPVCELCAPLLLDVNHWHCLHEIPSREWVMCTSSAWFQVLTLPSWIPSREWVVCTSPWFQSLTLPSWNPIQEVSCVHHLCLISITDIACVKSHPESELCAPPLLDFNHWHCMHEIPSREWVVCPSAQFKY